MTITASIKRPAAKPCNPYPAGKATPLEVVINDLSVLVIARRLHDEKCRERENCPRRDGHAMDSFEPAIRKTLGVMVDAHAAREI